MMTFFILDLKWDENLASDKPAVGSRLADHLKKKNYNQIQFIKRDLFFFFKTTSFFTHNVHKAKTHFQFSSPLPCGVSFGAKTEGVLNIYKPSVRQTSFKGGIDSLILHKNTVSVRVWFGDIKVIICKISVLVDLAPPVVTSGNSRCVLILQVPTRVSTTGGQQTRFCQKHNRRRTTWCVTNRSNCCFKTT